MADSLDKKFYGHIFKAKDATEVPKDEFVVFLAKDNAFWKVLPDYLNACVELGAGPDQVASVTALINRVSNWRSENPDRCKVPDIVPGERLLP